MNEELELAMAMAAASSECSSGCQSGWTTYLDDHSSSSYSRGTGGGSAPFHAKTLLPHPRPYYCEYSEEDDLSMISDASSGPRHQGSAGNDDAEAAPRANAEGRGRRAEAAAPRRQSKRAAAAAASLLEDTASSPAFFAYSSKAVSLGGEANGYGGADAEMTEIGNAADFSYAFSTTTGFKRSPLNGTALGGYMQMHYSPGPVKPMPRR